MIEYTLKCANDHVFESWFQSSEAFEKLAKSRRVECPECGSKRVEKSLMAPGVHGTKKNKAVVSQDCEADVAQEREVALAELRKQVEENSEYVGMNFAAEARAIQDGTAPERSIYGEAKPKDAFELIEDGVPVAPLPFSPKRKMN